MNFHANYVSTSVFGDGDYYQATFQAEQDTDDPDSRRSAFGASRRRKASPLRNDGIGSSLTQRWRRRDSNPRSLSKGEGRKGRTSHHARQGRPSSQLHLAARAARMAERADQPTPRGREWCRSFEMASSRAPAASTAAPLNRTRIAPVPVSRDCRSSPEHGVPCHHGEGVK